MNPRLGKPNPTAFTLIELLIVIAILAILAAMIVPMFHEPDRWPPNACMSKQKQILIGLTIFADDHQNAFPSMVPVTNGGAMEPMSAGDVTPCYLALTNGVRPFNNFICPADKSRFPEKPGAPWSHSNVSYFISLDAMLTNSPSTTILTGDRHLALDGKPVAPGLFPLSTTNGLSWTTELHSKSGGGFGFVDGHVEWANAKNLGAIVAKQTRPTNRLVVP